MKVKDFISTNKNSNVKWKINEEIFANYDSIPKYLLEKDILNWTVNQWEGIIEIKIL